MCDSYEKFVRTRTNFAYIKSIPALSQDLPHPLTGSPATKFMKLFLSAVLMTSAVSAHGAVFFTPVEVTSPNSTILTGYVLGNLKQGPGVGYNASEPHDILGAGGTGFNWVTVAPSPVVDYYSAFPAPILIIDLGQNRPLSEISTWGYAATNTNGFKDFTLRFATEAEGTGSFGTSITYSPSFEAAFSPTTRDSNPFSQSVSARYVEMTITDNWAGFQGAMAGGDRVGAGEIAFAAVPEPAAAALAGVAGLMALRRRRSPAVI